MRNKKNQSEAVGFVVIILIVVIVGIIFLGMYFRKGGVSRESAEIANFLAASLDYTTECAKDYETDYKSMKEVVIYCYEKRSCNNGVDSCKILESNYLNMLDNYKPAGTTTYRKISLYSMPLSLEDEAEVEMTGFLYISSSEGNSSKCMGEKFYGSMPLISNQEKIIIKMEVCMNSKSSD
jgi:hypothetical protein